MKISYIQIILILIIIGGLIWYWTKLKPKAYQINCPANICRDKNFNEIPLEYCTKKGLTC